MVDETTDISNEAQMSYVLRYSNDAGEKERFGKLEDVTEDKLAEADAARIISFLEECDCTAKVVAQCYDGATVMASSINGVQAKVKGTIPQTLVMSQDAGLLKECKIFVVVVIIHCSSSSIHTCSSSIHTCSSSNHTCSSSNHTCSSSSSSSNNTCSGSSSSSSSSSSRGR